MKMIAHIISTGEFSGAEKVAIEICDSLKKEFDFTYICKSGELEKYLKKKDIKYITYKNIRELIKILRTNNFDLIHAHDYTASIVASIFSSSKVISHIHNNTPFAKTLNIKSLMYYLVSFKLEKILCVSNTVIDEMYFKNRLKRKIKLTYNWINTKERFWLNNEEKNIDVLFVGRFTEQKNPMLFLEVIKELRNNYFENINVKMIGRGELKSSINTYIKENNLQSNIEVLEFTDTPHKYMKKSKIFFMPSKWEGFGLVILEALANGCTVVSTPVGGIKEIFGTSNEVLFNSKDDFINVIKKFINDDSLRMGFNKNSEKILSKFSMNKNIEKICQVYKEVKANRLGKRASKQQGTECETAAR